jgi:glycerol-3-phosphate dehydrogenase
LEKLGPHLKGTKAQEGWTGHAPLPGGDLDVSAIPALTAELIRDYPFLTPFHANRLAHAYGTRASRILGSAKSMDDLGQSFGASLTEAEIRYLISEEWACTAEDIIWRRSKLGLRLTKEEIAAIDAWISVQPGLPEAKADKGTTEAMP